VRTDGTERLVLGESANLALHVDDVPGSLELGAEILQTHEQERQEESDEADSQAVHGQELQACVTVNGETCEQHDGGGEWDCVPGRIKAENPLGDSRK
jgi:hypothetical protein